MAIRIPKMPQSGTHEALAKHLAQPEAVPAMRGVNLDDLGASEPYPVYFASLDDLESGTLPGQPTRWRQLLVTEERAVGEADLDPDGPRVVALHRGPRAGGTARAVETAHSLESVQAQDYELRLLESPGIYLVAIWLHGENDDVLIPIEPDRTGLLRHQPIALQDALPRLRERATFVKKAQNTERPSGA
jgi:hypothetical protein